MRRDERTLVNVLMFFACVILGFVTSAITDVSFFGLAVFTLSFGWFFLSQIKRVIAKPTHKAALTCRGERLKNEDKTSVYLNEGLHLLPFRPWFYDSIESNAMQHPFTTDVEVRTPTDNAIAKVQIGLAVRLDPSHIIEHQDSGGIEGVITHIKSIVNEHVRQWVRGLEEGPVDWEELQSSQLEAVSVLIKAIAGSQLAKIPEFAQEVPTYIWFRFLQIPKPTKFFVNERPWIRNNWKKVQDIYNPLSDDEKKDLEQAVEKRREEVMDISSGKGRIAIHNLGSYIERLNVGQIELLGKTAKMADRKAREIVEREAEKLELAHVRKRIQEIIDMDLGFSAEQALEVVQTERGKVIKTIDEKKLNLSPGTRDLLEKLGTIALEKMFSGKGGNE